MCTVLLPPGVNTIAVNKYISYHIVSYIISYISYHISSYHIISYHVSYHISVTQNNLKSLVTYKKVKLYGIPFTLLAIFFNSLEIINGLNIVFLCYL